MLSRVPKVIPYDYIIPLSMLFVTVDLAAVSMAYKMISLNHLLEINSGATFIFPMTYALGDAVAEVYGYRMAKNLIWLTLLFQFVFAILVEIVIRLPSPLFFQHSDAYFLVFDRILRFVLAGTAANIVSNFMNVYIVSKWKILMEGKFFWLRSIVATVISEFFAVAIIIGVGFCGGAMNFNNMLIMFKSTYSCEMIYALVLILPVTLIVKFLKRAEKIDVFDFNTNYNPFVFK